LYGEPQWAVVGDTFPVGCAYSDQVVFPEFFAANPDSSKPEYETQYGIYQPNCGLNNIHLSFGHDEYIFRVTQKYLPEEPSICSGIIRSMRRTGMAPTRI